MLVDGYFCIVALKVRGYHDQCSNAQIQSILNGDWLDSEVLDIALVYIVNINPCLQLVSFFMTIMTLRNKTALKEVKLLYYTCKKLIYS